MDGNVNPWMNRRMDGCMDKCMDPWIDGKMKGWIDGSMDGGMHGWIKLTYTYQVARNKKFLPKELAQLGHV